MSTTITRPWQDYAALEYLLLGDLRELLDEPFDRESRCWLLAILDQLLDTLHCEFTLEEEGGYMSEVLGEFPNWSRQVDQLLSEHQTLFTSLMQLRQEISYGSLDDEHITSVRKQLRCWMVTLAAHERHERRLVQDAFNVDIGAED